MDAPQQTSALLGCSLCLPVPLDRTAQPHLGTYEAQHPEDSGLTQAPGPTSRPLFSHVSPGAIRARLGASDSGPGGGGMMPTPAGSHAPRSEPSPQVLPRAAEEGRGTRSHSTPESVSGWTRC